MTEEEKIEYQRYLSTRKELDELEGHQQDSLDKQMLTLSAAALAFSLTFIEKAISLDTAEYVWLLLGSWVAFGISIVSTLWSFRASVAICKDCLSLVDVCYEKSGRVPDKYASKHSKRVDIYNMGAFWSFVIGLVFLVLFSIINIV